MNQPDPSLSVLLPFEDSRFTNKRKSGQLSIVDSREISYLILLVLASQLMSKSKLCRRAWRRLFRPRYSFPRCHRIATSVSVRVVTIGRAHQHCPAHMTILHSRVYDWLAALQTFINQLLATYNTLCLRGRVMIEVAA